MADVGGSGGGGGFQQVGRFAGVGGERVLAVYQRGDAGAGELNPGGEGLRQAAAVEPYAFGRLPAQHVVFAGGAAQHLLGLAQGVHAGAAEAAGQVQLLLLGERQALQQGLQAVERVFVGLAAAGERGRAPAVEAAEALQVEGAAGFGASAGEAVAAEGLHAHHGADDVAVHIKVAGFDAAADVFHRAVDAAVDAAGEGVAFGVDLVDELVELVGAVADNVQDRAEHFALQVVQIVQFKQGGRDEGGVIGIFR